LVHVLLLFKHENSLSNVDVFCHQNIYIHIVIYIVMYIVISCLLNLVGEQRRDRGKEAENRDETSNDID
jgi:hypothetical protein